MTLAELITKVNNYGRQFTSCWIPIVDEQYVEIQDIGFEAEQDADEKWLIKMKVK